MIVFRKHPKKITIHSDNGGCYASYGYNLALKERGISHSYSRPKMPHDNSVAESFFNTLKREGIFLTGAPKSVRELKKRIKNFQGYYNSERPHENLNYLTPDEFERSLLKK